MSRPAMHPGKVLADQLDSLGVTLTELARQIEVPPNRISQIIKGKRSITGDTAVRLAHWFRTTPEFWLNLQTAYDLRIAQETLGVAIRAMPTRPAGFRPVPAEATRRKHKRAS